MAPILLLAVVLGTVIVMSSTEYGGIFRFVKLQVFDNFPRNERNGDNSGRFQILTRFSLGSKRPCATIKRPTQLVAYYAYFIGGSVTQA
jgi:hypothetical protein